MGAWGVSSGLGSYLPWWETNETKVRGSCRMGECNCPSFRSRDIVTVAARTVGISGGGGDEELT